MVRNLPLWETTVGMSWSVPNKAPYERATLYSSDIGDASVSKSTTHRTRLRCEFALKISFLQIIHLNPTLMTEQDLFPSLVILVGF